MSQTISSLGALALTSLLLVACGDDTGGGGGAGGSGGGSTADTTGAAGGSTTSTTTTTTTASSTTSGQGGGGEGGAGEGGGGGAAAIDVTLQFRGDVAGEPFSCGATYDVGTPAASVSLTDFRMYVHDVRLVTAEGDEVAVALTQDGLWQHEDLALLDFEDRTGACANGTTETRSVVEGTVPAGEYTGLAFKLGVPEALNHLDNASAPSPLNLTAMFWAWTSGYKFLRVDAVAEGAEAPFNLHVGAGGCVGDPALGEEVACSNPNVVEVVLDGFDPSTSVAVFDYADVVADSDVSANEAGAPGCMSGVADPECAEVFPLLGLDLATGLQGDAASVAFRVE